MGDHFGGHAKLGREALLYHGRQPVGFAQRSISGEEQMYFDELPVTRGPEAHAVIIQAQLCTNRIELLPYFAPAAGSE